VSALPVCKPVPGAAASLRFLGGPEMLARTQRPGALAGVLRGAAPGRAALLIPTVPPLAGAAAAALPGLLLT